MLNLLSCLSPHLPSSLPGQVSVAAHYKNTSPSILPCTATQGVAALRRDHHSFTNMPAVSCFHLISRKSSISISMLLLLLLLAGPILPSAAASNRSRPERSKARSEAKDEARSQDNSPTASWESSEGAAGLSSVYSVGEGGLWEPRSSSRCVPVPHSMALCRDVGYDTMRTPNLLGHRSPQEALQQSASWLPLLHRQCHPDARIFLCSLLAPVCLQRSVFAGATLGKYYSIYSY